MELQKINLPENEPVNFAGIPQSMLQPFAPAKETFVVIEYITKHMETKFIKIVCEHAGHLYEDYAVAIINLLMQDRDIIAIKQSRNYHTVSTGEIREGSIKFHPRIRIGKNEWANICPSTWNQENRWFVQGR